MLTIGAPTWLLLLVPMVVMLVWTRMRHRRWSNPLPGAWHRAIAPELHAAMSRSIVGGSPSRWPLLAIVWVLLVLALAQPVLESEHDPDRVDVAGRSFVLDLSKEYGLTTQKALVARLLDVDPDVPVALVAATAESYTASPITSDRGHVERYLQALSPSMMPTQGRSLLLASAHAAGLLERAKVLAGQVVVLTSGPPPVAQEPMRDAAARAWITIGADDTALWRQYASLTGELVVDDRDIDPVSTQLRKSMRAVRSRMDGSGVRRLDWLCIAAASLFWCLVWRRQVSD